MMSTSERLVYMVNQIARNFAAIGHDAAATATADHIASFWDPRMREQVDALAKDTADAFTPIGLRAIALLREQGAPPSQTSATEFAGLNDAGHDDAG